MTLLDVPTYRRLTGDSATADAAVTPALVDAQRLVEEYLRRPLERAERTEQLRVYRLSDGRTGVYPSATPISAVPAGFVVEGVAVLGEGLLSGFTPWLGSEREHVTLTYTGGFVAATLPLTIAREIARLAQQLTQPVAAAPAGAKSVRVGDVAVTYATPTGGGVDAPGRLALRGYRRRVG